MTLADVARRAGVSTSTVSRALNGTAPLSPATVARVRRAVDALGYSPHRSARHLAGGRTGAIAVVVPDLTNPFFATIARGAQHRALENGELTVIADAEDRPSAELELIARLVPDVDGVVLCSPTAPTARLVAALGSRPAVLVNRPIRGRASVVADQRAAVLLAHDHLSGLGHERIAYVRGPAGKWTSSARDAQAGRLGLDLVGPVAPTFGGGARAASALPRGTTAVIAHNDLVAVGLVDALTSSGRRVPEDVSVVGCDDVELASLVRPALTTVRMPLEQLGRRAVDRLAEQISGSGPVGSAPTAADPVLAVTLTVRGSTAPYAAGRT